MILVMYYKMKKRLITILLTTIVAYVIRSLFIYCSNVDVLSIQEHPVICFLAVFGITGVRVLIRERLENNLFMMNPAGDHLKGELVLFKGDQLKGTNSRGNSSMGTT